MSEGKTSYPLSWPNGWRRTAPASRQRARFAKGTTTVQHWTDGTGAARQNVHRGSKELSVADATRRLIVELGRLGVRDYDFILSTNVQLRLDGLPYSNQKDPADPGAAVYFKLKGQPRALACDRWLRVADNIAAIAAHVEAIRAVDRYGVGTLDQAFAGYAALPPAAEDWRSVFGLNGGATIERVEQVYREMALTAHPDRGGDPAVMSRLNVTRDAARVELQVQP